MKDSLLLGLWSYIFPIPRTIWHSQVFSSARHIEGSLAFMSADHHRVRNFVVKELPGYGKPMPPEFIAEKVDLPLDRLVTILKDLEIHKTFLFRNESGEVTWAYPVTVEQTPHRIIFDSGEEIFAA